MHNAKVFDFVTYCLFIMNLLLLDSTNTSLHFFIHVVLDLKSSLALLCLDCFMLVVSVFCFCDLHVTLSSYTVLGTV